MTTNTYHYAIGRRKTSTATVRMYAKAGASTINGKPLEEVLPSHTLQTQLLVPFITANLKPGDFHFTVKSKGGGVKGQLGAIRLAIARSLVKMDPDLKKPLKKQGLLTRDPRMVERKKPGLRKARKAEQFSKR